MCDKVQTFCDVIIILWHVVVNYPLLRHRQSALFILYFYRNCRLQSRYTLKLNFKQMNAKQRQHALAVKTTHCNNGLVM